jgi:hypothetical protein
MRQGPSWQANSHSASQEILRLLYGTGRFITKRVNSPQLTMLKKKKHRSGYLIVRRHSWGGTRLWHWNGSLPRLACVRMGMTNKTRSTKTLLARHPRQDRNGKATPLCSAIASVCSLFCFQKSVISYRRNSIVHRSSQLHCHRSGA